MSASGVLAYANKVLGNLKDILIFNQIKTNIGKLEGSVQIQSTLGEGTTFNISIPLKS